MDEIILHPIGIIYTPYKESKDIPIQGIFKSKVEACVKLKDKYVGGLKDLNEFSHAILIYYFHKSVREDIEGKPFLEQNKHGIFAIRSPHRPNHIGFSIVKISRIEGNKLYFTEVDILDKTPLLDIKPYIKYFDSRDNIVSGWLEKHFKNGSIPKGAIPSDSVESD
ncbi:tRNA (N6-threonylcarbamoyladenosine(37)-N6)-methyltransferase TrmO [candidate division WOR-3 bacterium]|nr:tRNA (N6-threonylcarbamoyladenosine(37)-N6)-methyltransferase TrmO [candidate division WOR-3 bacterium]